MEPGGASASHRSRFTRELRGAFLDARRAAAQLRSHAGRAPYPRMVDVLRMLAERAEAQAAAVADEIRSLAGNADPADPTPPRDGRNHWERLSVDLADLEALKRRYVELALRWDVDFPQATTRLHACARATAALCRTLRDLLALSDPHAA